MPALIVLAIWRSYAVQTHILAEKRFADRRRIS